MRRHRIPSLTMTKGRCPVFCPHLFRACGFFALNPQATRGNQSSLSD